MEVKTSEGGPVKRREREGTAGLYVHSKKNREELQECMIKGFTVK